MNKKIAAILIFALVLALGGITVFGDSTVPGSPEDPVVSKSYVDSALAYKVLYLEAGKTLLGVEGTEIIVRSGEVTAIDNGLNGISDISQGLDLMTGAKCKTNHLLLIPRDDGRGIKAHTEAYIMIRGGYSFQ